MSNTTSLIYTVQELLTEAREEMIRIIPDNKTSSYVLILIHNSMELMLKDTFLREGIVLKTLSKKGREWPDIPELIDAASEKIIFILSEREYCAV